MELIHGGDWAGYRAEFGRDALDFSANVSPLRIATRTRSAGHCALSWPRQRVWILRKFCAATVRRT